MLKNTFHKVWKSLHRKVPLFPSLSPAHSAPSLEATYSIWTFSQVTNAHHCRPLKLLLCLSFLLHCQSYWTDLPALFFLLSASYVPLPLSEEDPWWTNDGEQNESDPTPDTIPDSCTGCILKLPVQVVPLANAPKTFERLHPLLIKVSTEPGSPTDS